MCTHKCSSMHWCAGKHCSCVNWDTFHQWNPASGCEVHSQDNSSKWIPDEKKYFRQSSTPVFLLQLCCLLLYQPFSAPLKFSAASPPEIASAVLWVTPSSVAKRREPLTSRCEDRVPLAQNIIEYHDDNSFYGSDCRRKTQMWNRNLTALYDPGYLTETWESL